MCAENKEKNTTVYYIYIKQRKISINMDGEITNIKKYLKLKMPPCTNMQKRKNVNLLEKWSREVNSQVVNKKCKLILNI